MLLKYVIEDIALFVARKKKIERQMNIWTKNNFEKTYV